jgi:hypothetical protein
MGTRRRIPWFEICVAYRRAPGAFGRELAPPTRSTYLRIARLPVRIGDALDDGGAPLHVHRFIAWGSAEPDTVERRYATAARLREELGRWPPEPRMRAALAAELAAVLAEEEPPSSRAA